MYTKHAECRMQQRGIPPLVIDLLLDHGDRAHDRAGAEVVYFGKRGRRHLRRYAGRDLARHLDPWLRVYAVVADGRVVTCGVRRRRIRRP